MQGVWSAPQIPNPNFVDDADLYKLPPLKYVAFELWQVKAGTIFDNIMVTDSLDEALQFAKDTWGKNTEAEKAMFEKVSVRHRLLPCRPVAHRSTLPRLTAPPCTLPRDAMGCQHAAVLLFLNRKPQFPLRLRCTGE